SETSRSRGTSYVSAADAKASSSESEPVSPLPGWAFANPLASSAVQPIAAAAVPRERRRMVVDPIIVVTSLARRLPGRGPGQTLAGVSTCARPNSYSSARNRRVSAQYLNVKYGQTVTGRPCSSRYQLEQDRKSTR